MRRQSFRRCQALASPSGRILVLTFLLLSTPTWAQDFSIDWHSIDGGGEVLSETGDQQWQLSGTLGQWDDSASQALSGTGWTLTGGFWPVNIDQTNIMFRDGFEGEAL